MRPSAGVTISPSGVGVLEAEPSIEGVERREMLPPRDDMQSEGGKDGGSRERETRDNAKEGEGDRERETAERDETEEGEGDGERDMAGRGERGWWYCFCFVGGGGGVFVPDLLRK